MDKNKLVLVGSTGTLGKEVHSLLKDKYSVVTINRTGGDFKANMMDEESLEAAFKQIGKFDYLISTSGFGKWAAIDQMTHKDYLDGLMSKLMGQVNLVLVGRKYANKGATFVLSSGQLAHKPSYGSSSLSMINAGVEAFVKALAMEPISVKVNAVSPSFAKETMAAMGLDSSSGRPAAEIARLYERAISEGTSGIVYQ